jgi:hypothetical protein
LFPAAPDVSDLLNNAAFVPFTGNLVASFANLKNRQPPEADTLSLDCAILRLIAPGEPISIDERLDKFPIF